MKLSLWILGTEVFAITTGDTEATYDEDDLGDCTTTAVGFTQRHDIPDTAGLYFDWGTDDSLHRPE